MHVAQYGRDNQEYPSESVKNYLEKPKGSGPVLDPDHGEDEVGAPLGSPQLLHFSLRDGVEV